jgi:chaperonin GroES
VFALEAFYSIPTKVSYQNFVDDLGIRSHLHIVNNDILKMSMEQEMSKIRPLHDNVVIRRVEKETKTAGGLILSTSAAEQPAQGEIIAVGNGKITDNGVRALDVKVGDNVLFGAYAGTKVKVEGEELLVMKESDILAVLEG